MEITFNLDKKYFGDQNIFMKFYTVEADFE